MAEEILRASPGASGLFGRQGARSLSGQVCRSVLCARFPPACPHDSSAPCSAPAPAALGQAQDHGDAGTPTLAGARGRLCGKRGCCDRVQACRQLEHEPQGARGVAHLRWAGRLDALLAAGPLLGPPRAREDALPGAVHYRAAAARQRPPRRAGRGAPQQRQGRGARLERRTGPRAARGDERRQAVRAQSKRRQRGGHVPPRLAVLGVPHELVHQTRLFKTAKR